VARASDSAYARLRSEILSWQLEPGSVLAEVELSSRLGISRTPVREALARLVADGLAEPQGGRGLVVTPVSVENVTELFELRQALEQQAAALAAERRDPAVFRTLQDELREVPALLASADPLRRAYYDLVARFDDAVDEAVRNPYLVGALNAVRIHLARIRRLSHDNPARLLEAAREHLLIVDAIVDGDVRLAADATRVHLYRSLQSTLGSLEAEITVPEALPSETLPSEALPSETSPSHTSHSETPQQKDVPAR
jgi:DNA-binding GntR family transcriptional regulator